MTHAKHVTSTNGTTSGRIPPKVVTSSYLSRLVDEACRRYRSAMDPDKEGLNERVERYTQSRRLLDEEIERYRRQGRENGR